MCVPSQFLTTAGRVYVALQGMAQNSYVVATHRELAAAAGLKSHSRIAGILERLEEGGYIVREEGLIKLLIIPSGLTRDQEAVDTGLRREQDGLHGDQDRVKPGLACEQSGLRGDQSTLSGLTGDQAQEETMQGIREPQTNQDHCLGLKREQNGCKVIHDHDLASSKLATSYGLKREQDQETPLIKALKRDGAYPDVIKSILSACPERSVEEYEKQLAWAKQNPKNQHPALVVWSLWKRGENVFPVTTATAEQKQAQAQLGQTNGRYTANYGPIREKAALGFGKVSDEERQRMRERAEQNKGRYEAFLAEQERKRQQQQA